MMLFHAIFDWIRTYFGNKTETRCPVCSRYTWLEEDILLSKHLHLVYFNDNEDLMTLVIQCYENNVADFVPRGVYYPGYWSWFNPNPTVTL